MVRARFLAIPYPKWNPGYFPCSSLTHPSAFLSIGPVSVFSRRGETL